ncbi:uncharacterized protein LOC123550967 isoform X2 [Mercenaria mercenaria]|uniref:uncharacterized protein LOC123550967 isoform X2 n=1 Tax=Mercenaria mercenaria TaxID=6596 RepID=UPI00234E9F68|nr:uncharacterized protein LOC123550967 isoform X2 [Mercenaria mercenaria]
MTLTQDSIIFCTDSIQDLSIGQDKKTGPSESSSVDNNAASDRVDGGLSIERQTACLNQASDTDGDHFNNDDWEDKNCKQTEGQRTEDDASKNDTESKRSVTTLTQDSIKYCTDSIQDLSIGQDKKSGPSESSSVDNNAASDRVDGGLSIERQTACLNQAGDTDGDHFNNDDWEDKYCKQTEGQRTEDDASKNDSESKRSVTTLTQDSIKYCTDSVQDLSIGQDKKTGPSESSSVDNNAASDKVDGGLSIERQTACLNQAGDTDGDHFNNDDEEDKNCKQTEGQRTKDDASKNDSESKRSVMTLTQDSIKCCTDSTQDLSIGQDKKTGPSESSSVDNNAASDRVDGRLSIERQTACLNQAGDTDGDHFNNDDGEDKDCKQSEGQRTKDDASKNDSESKRSVMTLTQDSIKCCTDSIQDISIGQDKKTGPSESSSVDNNTASDRVDGRLSIERQTACLNQAGDTDGDHFNNDDGEDKDCKQSEGQRTEDDASKNDSESKRSMMTLTQDSIKCCTDSTHDLSIGQDKKTGPSESSSVDNNAASDRADGGLSIERQTACLNQADDTDGDHFNDDDGEDKDCKQSEGQRTKDDASKNDSESKRSTITLVRSPKDTSQVADEDIEKENLEFSSDGINPELEEPDLELLEKQVPDLELPEEPNTKLLKYGKRKQKVTIAVLIRRVWSLLILILLHCRGESNVHELCPKSLPKVPYNISELVDIFIYTVGFRGPTVVPAENRTEEPSALPPANLYRNGMEAMNTGDIPESTLRTAENDSRYNDYNTNVDNPVIEEPLMCSLNDANSSSIAGDNIYDDSGNYNSVRDGHLDITVRQQSCHSTVPLPSLKNTSSQYQSTFDAVSIAQENYMPHFAYTGTSCTVANERFPFGEVRSRLFQDGRSTAAAVPRRGTTHIQEGTRPQSDDVEIQSYLFNLTQFNSPYDIPPGLSDRNNRANTFRYLPWPHAYPAPQQMADAGFFYTGIRDVTQCFYCGNCIDDWNPGDDPFVEHRNLYPDCNYVIVHSQNRAPSEPQMWNLQPQTELNRSDHERFNFSLAPGILFGPHRSQESSGIQETCGSQNVSSQTEGPSLVHDEIEEAVSRQHRRSPPDRRSVSLMIQPEFHVEATDQSHQPGITPAGNPSAQRVRPTERIRRPGDIEGILDSQVGRLVLYEGFSRRNVAEAVENILRDDGVVTYHSILMALVALGARLRRRRGVRPC